jgi:lactate permease
LVYVLWSLPVLVVVILVASRRVSSESAGFCGLVVSISVGLASAPIDFGPRQAMLAVAQGTWLALLVGSVILAGLTFRELIFATAAGAESTPIPCARRRGELYAACFLFGPFAESATGFGVGQVTIAPILRRLNLAPIDAVLLGLFSQTMVPWGALANGTIVGAQLSGLTPMALGVHSAALTAPLLLGWLCLFWRFAARAGVAATWLHLLAETAVTVTLAGGLVIANIALGPEVAAMATLAPFIAVRFLLNRASDRKHWQTGIGTDRRQPRLPRRDRRFRGHGLASERRTPDLARRRRYRRLSCESRTGGVHLDRIRRMHRPDPSGLVSIEQESGKWRVS